MILWLVGCINNTGNTTQNAARLSIQWGEVPFEIEKSMGLNSDSLRSIEAAVGERSVIGGTQHGTHWDVLANSNELLIGMPATNEIRLARISEFKSTTVSDLDVLYTGAPDSEFGTSLIVSKGESIQKLIIGAPRDGYQDGGWAQGSLNIVNRMTGEIEMTLIGQRNGESLGNRLFQCADLDKDGITDWVAGASMVTHDTNRWAGSVYWGLSRDWSNLRGRDSISLLHETQGNTLGGRFGYAVHCEHDVDGDGQIDTLVGAPFADSEDEDAVGSITVFRSFTDPADLVLDNTRRTLSGLNANDWLGWSIGAGDIDGDGKPEVIGGAPGSLNSAGEAFIWFGSDLQSQSEPPPRIRLQGESPGDSFGRSVSISDVNGDGFGDVIIGAPTATVEDRIAAGLIYVFFGGDGFKGWLPIRSGSEADIIQQGDKSGQNVGQLIKTADIDQNGADEIMLLFRE